MTDLLIYGVGPLAKLMHFYFTHDSDYRVVAFTADSQFVMEKTFCGLPVLPFDIVTEKYPPDSVRMFVAIGYRHMRNRQVLFDRAKAKKYVLANYISSRTVRFPDLRIGENNVAMANVQFEPFVTVGDNNLFWSDTLIGHEVSISDHNYVAAKCLISGNCIIEDGCFLANGVVLINALTIKRESHLLPGSVVMQNTQAYHRYMGNPARVIGNHKEHGIVVERG